MYAISNHPDDLEKISGCTGKSGFLIVQPGKFGIDGEAIITLPENTKESDLRKAMEKALQRHEAEKKNTRRHIQEGRKEGVHWETEIPVTDSGGKRRKGK